MKIIRHIFLILWHTLRGRRGITTMLKGKRLALLRSILQRGLGISAFLLGILEAFPEKTAVVSGERRLTYQDLKERVFRLANGLVKLGLREGDNLAIMLRNSNEFLESAVLAPIFTGSKAALINYHFRADEIYRIVSDADSRVFILEEEFLEEVIPLRSRLSRVKHFIVVGKEAPGDMIRYEDLINRSVSHEPDYRPRSSPPGSTGAMIYTGGTTGRPKGTNTFGVLIGALLPTGEGPSFDVGETMGMFDNFIAGFDFPQTTNIHLVAGPLYHAAPIAFALVTILLGGTLIMMRKFDPGEALKLIEREEVSTTFMAPILLKRSLGVPDRAKYNVSSMKSVVCAAAPCPAPLKKEVNQYFGAVFYEFYGSSDAGINTILRPEHYLTDPARYASVGKVAPGNELKILDEGGRECPPGVSGDLYIKNYAKDLLQYYKDPEKTSSSFRLIDGERYFIEGEVAYLDADGFCYIVDRKKDMIISGGVNIYPAEIEEVIHAHPEIMDVAVIGVPDPDWGESVKAIVQLKEGSRVSEEEIIQYCKERLAGYKSPKSVEFMRELPRDPDGKLWKRKLKEMV